MDILKEETMTLERALYIAGRALGELIYEGDGYDPDEMKEWIKNEYELTEEEMEELDVF